MPLFSKKCPVCHALLHSRDARFCTKCGTPALGFRGPITWLRAFKARGIILHAAVGAWLQAALQTQQDKFAERTRIKKAEVRAVAEQRLAAIHYKNKQLHHVLEMNAVGARGDLIIRLSDRTAKALDQIRSKRDWPAPLAELCERNILRLNEHAQRSIVKSTKGLDWRFSALVTSAWHFIALIAMVKFSELMGFVVKPTVLVFLGLATISFAATWLWIH